MMRQQNLWQDLNQQAIVISTVMAAFYQLSLRVDFASQKIHTPSFNREPCRLCHYAFFIRISAHPIEER